MHSFVEKKLLQLERESILTTTHHMCNLLVEVGVNLLSWVFIYLLLAY